MILGNIGSYSGTQYWPKVATLKDGNFIITWADDNGNNNPEGGSSTDTFGQVYKPDGTKVGAEFGPILIPTVIRYAVGRP